MGRREAEAVLLAGPQDQVELAELVLLDPEVFDQVHVRAENLQRLGIHDQ
jgi:hypothetical protein